MGNRPWRPGRWAKARRWKFQMVENEIPGQMHVGTKAIGTDIQHELVVPSRRFEH